jgi:hypothetical protein
MVSKFKVYLEAMETDSCSPDPRYEEEVSGCTASVGILSSKKIYVVCGKASRWKAHADHLRGMPEILEVF